MAKLDDLHTAVATDDAERLRSFIANEPDLLLQRGADGCTPLLIAARDGRVSAVRLLVESGADLEARDPDLKRTPLAWATFHGHREIVQYLIECGADVNASDAYGNTPLKTATMGSQGAWREWVNVPPHEYEAIAGLLRDRGATEKHEEKQKPVSE